MLLRDNLPPLFDSNVICEYLDTLHEGPPLIPELGEKRWRALRLQALAQGMADAGISLRWETFRRPEAQRNVSLAVGYAAKLTASYQWLENHLDTQSDTHIGHIALATALSWIEFRNLLGFRNGQARLSDWFDDFASRPSMLATPLTGETSD